MRCALLPLKDLVAAKTRLSGLLRPSERRALMQALVEDVLSVLVACKAIDHVLLLSDDPGAPLLAAAYGVEHLPEPDGLAGDLNGMIERVVSSRVEYRHWLVLHGDLPQLGVADLAAALQTGDENRLVLGPDQGGVGTNLLAFPAAARPEFAFGEHSCARHGAWAAGAGVELELVHRPGIACDVDCPADLFSLLEAASEPSSAVGIHTKTLLQSSAMGARLLAARDGTRYLASGTQDEGGVAPT